MAPPENVPSPELKLASKPVILCVEDNEVYLRLRKAVLEQAGYAVLTATTGTEAMEILREAPVCLVLSDPHAAWNDWHFSCETDEEDQAQGADHPVLGQTTRKHAKCGRLHQ